MNCAKVASIYPEYAKKEKKNLLSLRQTILECNEKYIQTTDHRQRQSQGEKVSRNTRNSSYS